MKKSSTPVLKSKSAAIVGGGNVAMDAARCAKRLGADVHIVYRRGEAELPARLEEIHHAKEEGIHFNFLTSPVEIHADEKRPRFFLGKMELGEPDASGAAVLLPIKGSEFELPVDMVIMAIGTRPNPMSYDDTPNLDRTKKGTVAASDDTCATSVPAFTLAVMPQPAPLQSSLPWVPERKPQPPWQTTC